MYILVNQDDTDIDNMAPKPPFCNKNILVLFMFLLFMC
jgi:hypothetical protein